MTSTTKKRTPWNKGKRKPITDDLGKKWCNCEKPQLTSNSGGPGQAFCLKCMNYWYN